MAFREPMGFAPTAQRRRGSTPKKKSAGKRPRRRAAVVGGVSRIGPATNPTKEKRTMAKKPRSAAQKAATKRMLAANKRRRVGKPTAKKPTKAKAKKKIGVKTSPTGRRSVKSKSGTKPGSFTPKATKLRNTARKATKTGVTRTYKQYKNKKYGVVVRENPANRGKAIVAAAGGFALGIVSADLVDRYIATRPTTEGASALMGADAKVAINAKPDSYRMIAQAVGTGANAFAAYMLRKKSMVGAYVFGGMAAAFAAKGLGMLVKGHLMPMLIPAKESNSDFVKRLAYGDLAGPRGYMGAPRPFPGKSTRIGPQATGSVGNYGCTRVPVNPAKYMAPEPGKGPNCSPFPFPVTNQGSDCIDKVSRGPSGTPPRFIPTDPSMPMPVPGPDGEPSRDGEFQPLPFEKSPPTPPRMRFQPQPPPRMPGMPQRTAPNRIAFSPINATRNITPGRTRTGADFRITANGRPVRD